MNKALHLVSIMATTLLLSGCASAHRVTVLEQDIHNMALVIIGMEVRLRGVEDGMEEPRMWEAF